MRRILEQDDEGSVFRSRGYSKSPQEIRIMSIHFSGRMANMARFLSTLPGRKNLILFSGGMPRSLFFKSGLREVVDDRTQEMTTATTPLITINTKGPNTGAVAPNEFLQSMSNVSIGKAFAVPADVSPAGHIERAIREFIRCYYVLSYPIEETWDGKSHEIAVRAKNME